MNPALVKFIQKFNKYTPAEKVMAMLTGVGGSAYGLNYLRNRLKGDSISNLENKVKDRVQKDTETLKSNINETLEDSATKPLNPYIDAMKVLGAGAALSGAGYGLYKYLNRDKENNPPVVYPQQGYPQQMYPQQMYPQQGYPQQMYPQNVPREQIGQENQQYYQPYDSYYY